MKFFYISFSFRDIKTDSFAFLSLAPIIMQQESALNSLYQRQSSRGALSNMCSDNMQQIYRRTPTPKCDILNLHFDMGLLLLITWLSEICLTSLIALFWNFPLFWNFSLMICNFPLLFCHSKNIRMSTLITIIITYYLLIIIIIIIITKSHNNYCSVGVIELCLLNVYIDWLFFV